MSRVRFPGFQSLENVTCAWLQAKITVKTTKTNVATCPTAILKNSRSITQKYLLSKINPRFKFTVIGT